MPGRRPRFDPMKVESTRVDRAEGYWTVWGRTRTGMLVTYRVTDKNLGEVWRFQLRQMADGQVSVHVLEKPAKKKYAAISEIAPSIVFAKVSTRSRLSYHPIGLWTPDGTRRVARGSRGSLPAWFACPPLRGSIRVYSRVKGGGASLANKQVVICNSGDQAFMIRAFFAEKIWPMVIAAR